MTTVAAVLLLGFALGIALGLTGVGAGSVLTPVLVLFAGVRPVVAVGTSLVFSVIAKAAGSIQHARQGTADLRTVRWMAAASLPSAITSLILVHTVIPSGVLLDAFTKRAIAAALFVVAAVLTLRFLDRIPSRRTPAPRPALLALGVVIGVTVALTSVGSGSVAIACLGLLTPMAAAQLVGTDMVHAALLSAVTAPFYLASGNVDIGLAVGLATGAVPGVVLASRATAVMPERLIRGAVVVAVWVVALLLV